MTDDPALTSALAAWRMQDERKLRLPELSEENIAAEVENTRPPEVLGELLTILKGLREDGPTDAEMDKAKKRLRWFFRDLLDDATEATTFVASFIVIKPFDSRQP